MLGDLDVLVDVLLVGHAHLLHSLDYAADELVDLFLGVAHLDHGDLGLILVGSSSPLKSYDIRVAEVSPDSL